MSDGVKMTVDERLEFLLKSTESLHDSVQKNTDQIATLAGRIDALVHAVEIDAENIRRLANIAAAHEERLDDLENKDKL